MVCDESGWLALSGDTCPLCGEPTRPTADVVEEPIEAAAHAVAVLTVELDNPTGYGRILRSSGAALDHPVHPNLPETAYLKALTLQLD